MAMDFLNENKEIFSLRKINNLLFFPEGRLNDIMKKSSKAKMNKTEAHMIISFFNKRGFKINSHYNE